MPPDGVGFYQTETVNESPILEWPKDKPFQFRWTGGQASMPIKNIMPDGFKAFVSAHHPDIENSKVTLNIYGNATRLITLDLNTKDWQKITIPARQLKGVNILTFQVSRTWNPKLAEKKSDDRDLGIALAVPVQ